MDLKARQDEKTEVTALIERAIHGDDSVWGEVYEKTNRYVYFLTLKSLRNEQDAQDIVHDVYIQVIRSIGQLYNADSFYGWLRRIIFSKCMDFIKKKKPVLEADIDEDLESVAQVDEAFLPESILDSAETRRMVMELIDALPDAQRQSVLFYYYDEMMVDQIAALMECSPGTVKSRLNYARAKIKAGVEEHRRRGTKLYGVSALPILTILLHEQAQAMEIPSALGAGLAPILGGTSSTIGTTATAGTGAVITKTAGTLSAKFIAGIVAGVIAVGGGITAWVLTHDNLPPEEAPVAIVSETANANESEAQTEPLNTAIPVHSNFVVPESITAFMDNLYDALYNADMNLAYTLMLDENVHSWFSSLDNKTEIFYIAESGQVTTGEYEHGDDDYNYRDRLNYSKSSGEGEPYFGIEFVQSRNDPEQITMMVQYGKRENGFVYHNIDIHYFNGEIIQLVWDDLSYQDGKATGAFKRYTFQPIGSTDLFANYWIVQSGNTIDGFYEGDVFEEQHHAKGEAGEQFFSTWLLKYEGGIIQPISGTDAEGNVPYASFVGDTMGTLEQPPQTMPADSPEWGEHRPYEAIGLR